jgi:hypothetical protein
MNTSQWQRFDVVGKKINITEQRTFGGLKKTGFRCTFCTGRNGGISMKEPSLELLSFSLLQVHILGFADCVNMV